MGLAASKLIVMYANSRFFPVTIATPEPSAPLENLINAAIDEASERDYEYQRTLNIIKDSKSLVTKTPWLRRTRWEEMFAGKDMNMLNQLAHSPDPRDTELQQIWSSVDRVVRACFRGVLDCHARGWELVLFWMASVDRNKEDTKPFRTHMELRTMARYIGYWQQYIMLCVRAITTDDSVPFTPRQHQCIEQLIATVELDGIVEDYVIDQKVLELSVLLIQHSDYATQRSSLVYFCGVLGFNTEWKQWRQPQDYTTILAGIQWCVRVFMLQAGLPMESRDDYTEDSIVNPVEAFCTVRDKWLVDGEGTPFGYIHRLLNYGMQAAKNTTTRSRVRWSADNKTLYFDGRALKLELWIEFVQGMLETTEALLSQQLFMKDGELPAIDLSVMDDPSNHDAGHYWVLDEGNAWQNARSRIIQCLKTWDQWDRLVDVEGDGISWNTAGVHEYEAKDVKLRELLAILMMIVCGLSGRGTELTSLRYVNTVDGDRGIYVEDGQLMFITEYHKSMALMDDVKVRTSGID
jgi:hypothetical protein